MKTVVKTNHKYTWRTIIEIHARERLRMEACRTNQDLKRHARSVVGNGKVPVEALRNAQVVSDLRVNRDHNETASKPPSSRTAEEPNVNSSLHDRSLMSVKLTHYIRLSRDRVSDSRSTIRRGTSA